MVQLKTVSAVALASLMCLACDGPLFAREPAVRKIVLASPGEVHDGVISALQRDPRYSIKDSSDRIEATEQTDQPYTIVAQIRHPEDGQCELEIRYEGPGSNDEKERHEREFLQDVLEAIKYAETGYNRAPDLRSPLDEGPRVEAPPMIPAVDNVRRY